jgi:hypothetical protein
MIKKVIKALYEVNIYVLEWHICHYGLNEFVFCLKFHINEKMKTCAGCSVILWVENYSLAVDF